MKVTDEAVRVARDAYQRAYPGGIVGARFVQMRAALEAALPHLEGATPPPLEQVIRHLHEYQHGDRKCVQGNCRKRDTAANLAPAVRALFREGATPAIDREALDDLLRAHNIERAGPGEVTCRGCRDKGWMSWAAYRRHVGDAIEALTRSAS